MTVIRFKAPLALARERHGSRHRSAGLVAPILSQLRVWRRRARDRARLGALDDRTLADIGLSRAEAQFLSERPFWRE